MIHIEKQSERFGAFTAIDTEALGIGRMRLSVGYSHAARLEFTVTAANHSLPFAYNDFVRVWDDEGTVDGSSEAQSADNPLFEGFVEEVTPAPETNEVRVVCYDPTYRAARAVPLMNGEWELDDDDKPVPAANSYPRVVFNVTQDNDDDYAFSIGQNHKLGQIIARVLTDAYLPLYHINAAPGDGSAQGNGQAWLEDDLGSLTSGLSGSSSGWAGGLSFEPQEKIVAHSETIRSFVERLLGQYDPTTKMLWIPGERLWRFFRVKQAPEITVTVNDPAAWHGAVVGLEIHRSIEGRYGAVKFYGPEGLEWRTAEWQSDSSAANTLEPINPQLVGSAPNVGLCYNRFQITDPDFTRIANKGPYAIYVPGPYAIWANASGSMVTELVETYQRTFSPSLQVRFPESEAGNDNWKTLACRWDARSGIVEVGDGCPYRWKPNDPTNKFEEPIGFRFIYPALTEPLTVRVPESGFEGTAFSVGGLEAERREYDESLAVGYAYGIPVTTQTRLDRFEELANQILEQVKDIVYAGAIVLDGLRYEFARLNRRVNLAAKDDDGNALITGWEDVGAIVTDAEFDLDEQTTTLQFSSDQMETIGLDPDLMKQRLKIRPAQLYFFFYQNVAYSYRWGFDLFGHRGLIQDTTLTVNVVPQWLDEFGEVQ